MKTTFRRLGAFAYIAILAIAISVLGIFQKGQPKKSSLGFSDLLNAPLVSADAAATGGLGDTGEDNGSSCCSY